MQDVPNPAQRLKHASQLFKPVSRGFSPRGWSGPGFLSARSAGFAAALQSRFGTLSGVYRSQGLVYRRNALGVWIQRIHRHAHLALAPRLHLTFQASPEHSARPQSVQPPLVWSQGHPTWLPPGLPAMPVPVLKPATVPDWHAGLASPAGAASRLLEIYHLEVGASGLTLRLNTQTVQRLAARLERLETVRHKTTPAVYSEDRALPTRTRPAQPVQAALPVQQVLIKKAPAVLMEEGRSEDLLPQHPPIRYAAWPSTAWDVSGIPPAELNIQRLADQVVQLIDNRVIARSERMGRI